MSSLNQVTLIGNLGADPDVRRLNSGDAVANLRIATAESWKDKQTGEKQERTEWHTVTLWGGLADVAERYLKKGSKVYVQGQLETRKWQDRDGNDRYSTEVVCRGYGGKLIMLGERSGGGGEPRQQQSRPAAREPEPAAALDDDIPF